MAKAKAKKARRDRLEDLLSRVARSQLRILAALKKLADQQRLTREAQQAHNAAMLEWLDAMGDAPASVFRPQQISGNASPRPTDDEMAERVRQVEGM